jgi:predicted ATP-grasp superfamily ATP-dependent carboligase
MRILVHEFASGGGFAGRPVPRSLAREGRAMLTALVADLASIGGHEIVTTTDCRFKLTAVDSVDVVPIGPGSEVLSDDLLSSVDAVWLIAPETGGCLEHLAAAIERHGKALLGAGSVAIQRASDKQRLPIRLARCGVAHPPTRALRPCADARAIADDLGYPVVVKPGRGAGCDGVCLARNRRELRVAIDAATRSAAFFRPQRGAQRVLLQRYVRGLPASVSLLSDGCRAVALSVNAQSVRAGTVFSYHGGWTPLDHPLAGRAIEAAIRTCEALPGLRGYVGIDVVLTRTEAVVIEVNPRLTTAYLGLRSAVTRSAGGRGNIAAMAIDACRGTLPTPPAVRRRVRFSSAGRIVALA